MQKYLTKIEPERLENICLSGFYVKNIQLVQIGIFEEDWIMPNMIRIFKKIFNLIISICIVPIDLVERRF